ncbi:hypothetical protein M1M11_08120 [Pseudomonas azerbaijanoccidens]|uniref:hypothetical protein n=1 Tax=Pseudomonas azerbaijanoccidentalis TaxID=2842347 RepID=UPI00200AA378|nr:hypothetical protein [Pseudomonas azerbaijanoccidentalis]MCK8664849.1 hypothetical protein [Pseudomonas azerbaijanoccidentalis]
MYLTDGEISDSLAAPLNGYPQGEDIKLHFTTQGFSGARLQLAEIMLRELDQELEFLDGGLYDNRLKNKNWIIERQYHPSCNFLARVGGKAGRYHIELSIGAALIALSASVELCSLQENSPTSELATQYSNGATSIESLFPGVTEPAQVGEEALGLALDVCLLLYLHEVAHAILGHCDYNSYNRSASSDEIRALEFDADFNAGAMFGLWVQTLPADYRKSKDFEGFLKRLVRASFLFSTILKAVSGRSANYHLPTNRMIAFLSGGAFAFDRTDKTPKFESDDEGDSYWSEKVSIHTESIKAALERSTLKEFLANERDVENDFHEIFNVTHGVRDSLKDGPLMKFRLNE